MRKVWNDLQKPLTWNDIERSETPIWSSSPPIQAATLDDRYKEISNKIDYANYLTSSRILGNILIDITFAEIMFLASYLNLMRPRNSSIINNIAIPENY